MDVIPLSVQTLQHLEIVNPVLVMQLRIVPLEHQLVDRTEVEGLEDVLLTSLAIEFEFVHAFSIHNIIDALDVHFNSRTAAD